MMAIAAASAVRAGASAEEAADAAHALRRGSSRSGSRSTRSSSCAAAAAVGGAQAWLGSTLKIKPILSIESEILPIERVRTSGRAFERLIEYLAARRGTAATRSLSSSTSTRRSQAQRLVGPRTRFIYGGDPRSCPSHEPLSGPTVGPGLLGVAGIQRALLYPRG